MSFMFIFTRLGFLSFLNELTIARSLRKIQIRIENDETLLLDVGCNLSAYLDMTN